MSAGGQSGNPERTWDEERIEEALARLEQFQDQIDGMRLAIHRVVKPLTVPRNNPEQLFAVYKAVVHGSQSDIKALRGHWQSQETQAILDHTKESFRANPDLSAAANVPQWGWRDVQERRRKAGSWKRKAAEMEDAPARLDAVEIRRIVDEAQKEHPQLHVEMENDSRELKIRLADGTKPTLVTSKLVFSVAVKRKANGVDKLDAECLGRTPDAFKITRCIASRPRANDLKYLLDMIAAYYTVPGNMCGKCKQRFDRSMQSPMARRSSQTTTDSGTVETAWQAIHESCLG